MYTVKKNVAHYAHNLHTLLLRTITDDFCSQYAHKMHTKCTQYAHINRTKTHIILTLRYTEYLK